MSDAVEGKPEFCGWMVKRGGVRKNWAKRWFELRGASLLYYKDAEGQSGRDRKGEVDLSRCSAARKSTNADAREFEIEILSDRRIYRFVPTESEDTAEVVGGWLEALDKAIREAHVRSPGSVAGGANDSDDEGGFDLSRAPPALDDFNRFRLTGRRTGEEVQHVFEQPVTLLLMDHSRHYCNVFLTHYRLAFMFWADVDEPAEADSAGGGGGGDAADDPYRAAVDNARIVSLPLIAIRELGSSSLSLGDQPDVPATEVVMQDSRSVRVVFDRGALLAEGDEQVAYDPTASAEFAAKFVDRVAGLRECIVCHEEGIETALNGPQQSFAREYVGGFDAAGWQLYTDPRSDTARMGVESAEGPGSKWKYFENDLSAAEQVCSTYGSALAVPADADAELIEQVGQYRKRGRIPFLSWLHPSNNASLTRCAQPQAGFTGHSEADILYFEKIAHTNPSKKLLIADARPRINAEVNKAKGGGYEDTKSYAEKDLEVELEFFQIENIHRMRESVHAMHDIVFDAVKEGVSDVSEIVKRLDRADGTRWKHHIHTMMNSVSSVVKAMTAEVPTSVVCHCSDGWDRTSQMTSLSMLCLDPYYRTMEGFAVAVEREWFSAGHKMRDRTWGHKKGEYSPIFLQFLDGTHQLIRQFPMAFEFNEVRKRRF
jgi:hypothetical protein